jgi:hypothetical protein
MTLHSIQIFHPVMIGLSLIYCFKLYILKFYYCFTNSNSALGFAVFRERLGHRMKPITIRTRLDRVVFQMNATAENWIFSQAQAVKQLPRRSSSLPLQRKTWNESQEAILYNQRVTVDKVAHHLCITYGFFKTDMGFTKVCARWVPKQLTGQYTGTRLTACLLLGAFHLGWNMDPPLFSR